MLYFQYVDMPLVRRIFYLSQDSDQNFPFVQASLGLTKAAIEATREGLLYESCKKCDETLILVVSKGNGRKFNTFFVEMFILLYKKWMDERLSLLKL